MRGVLVDGRREKKDDDDERTERKRDISSHVQEHLILIEASVGYRHRSMEGAHPPAFTKIIQ